MSEAALSSPALRSWHNHGSTINGIMFYSGKSIIGLME
jgi:hypothetical protein